MNTKKIERLLSQIQNASRVLSANTNDCTINIVSVEEPIGVPCNEVLYFGWEDEVGNEYVVRITEEGVNNAIVNDRGQIVFVDSDEGSEFAIRLYELKKIVPDQNW